MPQPWHTERLDIRQLRTDDWRDLHELQGDPEATFYVGGVWTEQKTREVVDTIVSNYPTGRLDWYAVADRASDKVMGVCWIGHMNAKWCESLGRGPTLELGYRYARAHWGKGIATEAAQAMIRRGFEELKLPEIHAIVDVRNVASDRVLQKLGMTHVGDAERDGVAIRLYRLRNTTHQPM